MSTNQNMRVWDSYAKYIYLCVCNQENVQSCAICMIVLLNDANVAEERRSWPASKCRCCSNAIAGTIYAHDKLEHLCIGCLLHRWHIIFGFWITHIQKLKQLTISCVHNFTERAKTATTKPFELPDRCVFNTPTWENYHLIHVTSDFGILH